MNGLENTKSMIVVFSMDGCPHCDDYLPRFHRLVQGFQAHGQPLVYYILGTSIMPGQIPVVILDAASEDESIVGLADQHAVEALPTTLLLRTTARPAKIEGAVDDQQIYAALASACLANR